MARQLIFKTNIDPANLLPALAPERSGFGGKLYFEVLPFSDREMQFLCRSPDGTKVVVTAQYGGIVYELSSRNVFNPRTQDIRECPPYKTFGDLERIAKIDPKNFQFELIELFFDFKKCTELDMLADEQGRWAQALQDYKTGKLRHDIDSYKRDKERR